MKESGKDVYSEGKNHNGHAHETGPESFGVVSVCVCMFVGDGVLSVLSPHPTLVLTKAVNLAYGGPPFRSCSQCCSRTHVVCGCACVPVRVCVCACGRIMSSDNSKCCMNYLDGESALDFGPATSAIRRLQSSVLCSVLVAGTRMTQTVSKSSH